jgi:pantoate--beta-alanine ligase
MTVLISRPETEQWPATGAPVLSPFAQPPTGQPKRRPMRVATTKAQLALARRRLHGRVAVVMTMGALHDGHAELIRAASALGDAVLVTIFVNPLQFDDPADLERYPRQLDADLALCRELGVDLVFAPDVEEMYPGGAPLVSVCAGPIAARFEGADRPGHFDGVCTVVAKLLHLTAPDVAVFGDKDAQQLAVIRAMVRDLDFGVEIVGAPTVREADGLARSSRNLLLSSTDRAGAVAIPRAIEAARVAAQRGATGAAVKQAARQILDDAIGVEPAYVALVDDATWSDAVDSTITARLLIAARVGGVRLIDNAQLTLAGTATRLAG